MIKSIEQKNGITRRNFLKILARTGAGATLSSFSLSHGCAFNKKPANQPRLVLLYAPCTVNKSCLSPYNSCVDYTPNLKRFASQGAVFEKCQVESGQSGTSYASIFSGYQADHHGILSHPRKIDSSVYLISEAFSENGYDVFFWNMHPMANYELNYGKSVPPENAIPTMLLASDKRFIDVLQRLSSDKNYKAFILTSFSVTHGLYYPIFPPYPAYSSCPPEIRAHVSLEASKRYWNYNIMDNELNRSGLPQNKLRKFHDLYRQQNLFTFYFAFDKALENLNMPLKDEEYFIKTIEFMYKYNISRLDNIFGEVIDRIRQKNLFNESAIVFTADHGETLYRDNVRFKFGHGFQLSPEVLSVPLIITAPFLNINSQKHEYMTRSIDIFPTIAGLCSLEIPRSHKFQGIDLSTVLTGKKKPPVLPAYSHTCLVSADKKNVSRNDPSFFAPEKMWVSVRHGDNVYKWSNNDLDDNKFKPSMFDLGKDPEERKNLFDPANSHHQLVVNNLKNYKEKMVNAFKEKYKNKDLVVPEEELLKKLRGLGYIR